MRFDPSFVSQMSVGLLLVKLVGLSIVCLSCYCRQSVVCKVQVAVGNGSVVFVLSYGKRTHLNTLSSMMWLGVSLIPSCVGC